MPTTRGLRPSRAATCEEWDDDAQTTVPCTRTSARVAAKRPRPELVVTTQGPNSDAADGAIENPAQAVTITGSSQKEKRSAALKLDTSLPDRQSRLYSSGPPADQVRQSAGRPATTRSTSKMDSAGARMRHVPGACSRCDAYGYHKVDAVATHGSPREKVMPPAPSANRKEPSKQGFKAKDKTASTSKPRTIRSQSHGGQRPMSFHAGTLPEAYHPAFSSPYVDAWHYPPTPMSPYSQIPYMQGPASAIPHAYQENQPFFHLPSTPQLQSHVRPPSRPAGSCQEPATRHESINDQPAIRQSRTRASSQEKTHARNASRSREDDARRMPPPQSIPVAHRPSIVKANTSTSAPVSRPLDRSLSYKRSIPAHPSREERRSDAPPSSYREAPPSAYPIASSERAASRKSVSCVEPGRSRRSSSSGPDADRRSSFSSTERHELEAEVYQRAQGTKAQALTVDAVRKISRRRDSGSVPSVTGNSRASSGGKSKNTGASNDIAVTVNGLTLGISGDGTEQRSIKIQPRRHGGVNISVDEQEQRIYDQKTQALPLVGETSTATSSSKQSHRSIHEKELERLRGLSFDRDRGQTSQASSRSGRVSFDDPPAYSLPYD